MNYIDYIEHVVISPHVPYNLKMKIILNYPSLTLMDSYFDILPDDIITKIFIKLKDDAVLLSHINERYNKLHQEFLIKLYDGKIPPFEVFDYRIVSGDTILKDVIKFMDSITVEDDFWRYGGHYLMVDQTAIHFKDIEKMKMEITEYLTGTMIEFLDEHINKYGYDGSDDDDDVDDYDYYKRYILLYNERKEFIFIVKEIELTEPSRIYIHVQKEYHKLWNLIFTHGHRDILLRSNKFSQYVNIHPLKQ